MMHWPGLPFERAVVTPYTFATVLVPVVLSIYLMAVLVQLPRTKVYRLALLPVIFWLTFRASMSLDFSWNHLGYAYLNQGTVSTMFAFAMRSTIWAFARQPYSKVPIRSESSDHDDSDANSTSASKRQIPVSVAIWNACDLVGNPRGIGWDGPHKAPIPTPYLRVESRTWFAWISFGQFIFLMLLFDALCTSFRLLGPDTFGTPQGGTIFDPLLSPPQRYLKSSLVAFLTLLGLYVIISATNQLGAISCTILFCQHPSQHPPLFDSPWLSTSLTSFWGRRWHQLFRDFFVEVGGKPLERYLGPAGKVMGTFAMSGLLHDIGVRAMGRDVHNGTLQTMGFFLMQGVGIIMEHLWRHVTGKRVSGLIGRLWCFLWLVSWGNMMVDVWAKSGLLGSELVPEEYSPSVLFLNWISRDRK